MAGKVAVQPKSAGPRSLTDFAKTRKPSSREIDQWFAERPDVVVQMEDGFKLFTDNCIFEWLKEDYQFPYSVSVIRTRRDSRKAR